MLNGLKALMQSRTAIGRLKLLLIIALIIVAGYLTWQYFTPIFAPPPPQKLIEVDLAINPSEFKASENATVWLTVTNLLGKKVTVAVDFETNAKNVKIYLGKSILDMRGGNYTYTITMDPSEQKGIYAFRVKAALETGDNVRSYYIRAYTYADGFFQTTREITFTVRR